MKCPRNLKMLFLFCGLDIFIIILFCPLSDCWHRNVPVCQSISVIKLLLLKKPRFHSLIIYLKIFVLLLTKKVLQYDLDEWIVQPCLRTLWYKVTKKKREKDWKGERKSPKLYLLVMKFLHKSDKTKSPPRREGSKNAVPLTQPSVSFPLFFFITQW